MSRSIRGGNPVLIAGFALALAACGTAARSGQAPAEHEPAAEIARPGDPLDVPSAEPENEAVSEDPFAGVSIRFATRFWPDTDFSKHSVDLDEFLSGGPPPDGIPSIDEPVFESPSEADEWLRPDMPVMFFSHDGDARAYPLAILIYHEIVNDVVGGQPVTLTFCPLCNSTIAFHPVLPDGTVLDFGTTGNLRNSDLVMYDRQTKSWWQQFTGEAIVGELTGTRLELLPSQIISWGDFKARHPDGLVLSRDTGISRPYGRNPYPGYDSVGNSPFLFDGELDGRLPAVERIVAVTLEGIDIAYPFSVLSQVRVVNDEVSGSAVVVFWQRGTSTTFGSSTRDVGSTSVFHRELNGQLLNFEVAENGFIDSETGSLWTIFGEAVEGPLAGSRLKQVVSGEHFWFAWAAFKPDTRIWQPPAA